MTTKEAIFNKSLLLFAEKGYSATSIRNICSEVGIKESSFYNHYTSKNQLLETIFVDFNKALLLNGTSDDQLDVLTTKLTLREMLHTSLLQYVGIWENPTASQMWFVISMEQYRNPIAGQIIIDEGGRRIYRTALTFRLFQKKAKMKDGDPLILANLYSFSIRSLHLDFGLRKLYNQNHEQTMKSMTEVCDFFCSCWEI
jgi:AcrR family transcriptional regulator